MTRSELIERMTEIYSQRNQDSQNVYKDVEIAVKAILDYLSNCIAKGKRIEIRGFGSFTLHYRAPRQAHNPKTGESLQLGCRYVPHFKPGKDLKEKINYHLPASE